MINYLESAAALRSQATLPNVGLQPTAAGATMRRRGWNLALDGPVGGASRLPGRWASHC
jgi:hypothetical protein